MWELSYITVRGEKPKQIRLSVLHHCLVININIYPEHTNTFWQARIFLTWYVSMLSVSTDRVRTISPSGCTSKYCPAVLSSNTISYVIVLNGALLSRSEAAHVNTTVPRGVVGRILLVNVAVKNNEWSYTCTLLSTFMYITDWLLHSYNSEKATAKSTCNMDTQAHTNLLLVNTGG